MPVYQERRKVAVSVGNQYNALYGFQTNIPEGDSGTLGHQAVTANMGQPVFFGSERPKPARVRKVTATGSTTSFLSATVDLGTLPDWVLVERARRGPVPRETNRSQLLYVPIYQAKYAWMAPKFNTAKLPAQLKNVVAGTDYCFIGANSIEGIGDIEGGILGKPPRAAAELAGTDGIDRVSTFIGYPIEGALPEGWVPNM